MEKIIKGMRKSFFYSHFSEKKIEKQKNRSQHKKPRGELVSHCHYSTRRAAKAEKCVVRLALPASHTRNQARKRMKIDNGNQSLNK